MCFSFTQDKVEKLNDWEHLFPTYRLFLYFDKLDASLGLCLVVQFIPADF